MKSFIFLSSLFAFSFSAFAETPTEARAVYDLRPGDQITVQAQLTAKKCVEYGTLGNATAEDIANQTQGCTDNIGYYPNSPESSNFGPLLASFGAVSCYVGVEKAISEDQAVPLNLTVSLVDDWSGEKTSIGAVSIHTREGVVFSCYGGGKHKFAHYKIASLEKRLKGQFRFVLANQ